MDTSSRKEGFRETVHVHVVSQRTIELLTQQNKPFGFQKNSENMANLRYSATKYTFSIF